MFLVVSPFSILSIGFNYGVWKTYLLKNVAARRTAKLVIIMHPRCFLTVVKGHHSTGECLQPTTNIAPNLASLSQHKFWIYDSVHRLQKTTHKKTTKKHPCRFEVPVDSLGTTLSRSHWVGSGKGTGRKLTSQKYIIFQTMKLPGLAHYGAR